MRQLRLHVGLGLDARLGRGGRLLRFGLLRLGLLGLLRLSLLRGRLLRGHLLRLRHLRSLLRRALRLLLELGLRGPGCPSRRLEPR